MGRHPAKGFPLLRGRGWRWRWWWWWWWWLLLARRRRGWWRWRHSWHRGCRRGRRRRICGCHWRWRCWRRWRWRWRWGVGGRRRRRWGVGGRRRRRIAGPLLWWRCVGGRRRVAGPWGWWRIAALLRVSLLRIAGLWVLAVTASHGGRTLGAEVLALAEPQDEPEDHGKKHQADGEAAAVAETLRYVVEDEDGDDEEGDAPQVGDERQEQKPGPGLRPAGDSKEHDEVVDRHEGGPRRVTLWRRLLICPPHRERKENVEEEEKDEEEPAPSPRRSCCNQVSHRCLLVLALPPQVAVPMLSLRERSRRDRIRTIHQLRSGPIERPDVWSIPKTPRWLTHPMSSVAIRDQHLRSGPR